MNTRFKMLLLLIPLVCWPFLAQAADDDEGHGDRTEIESEMARKVGIETAIAGPGTIERQVQVFGRLVTPPGQSARLRARFPGVITALQATVGDAVKQGQVLATIESNESLQRYQVKAPIAGIVQARSVNVGEFTGDAPLFELINTGHLWAELKVFAGQRDIVNAGQVAHIAHGEHTHEGQIAAITPSGDEKPYVLARVTLDNPDHHAAPGELISAAIAVETVNVPLMVANKAIQTLEAKPVVFVQEGDAYEARPLVIGRTDGRHTEVLSGLEAGSRYVVENSYLIKADIEKSGASHEH